MTLAFEDGHTEHLNIYLYHSAHQPLVLGFPWLKQHNPHIDWTMGKVLDWGEECNVNCIPPLQISSPVGSSVGKNIETINPDLSGVPKCYWDLKEVFSKSRATSLPPHRHYDCATDLLPGAPIPKGRLYSLSAPEQQAMEEYITAFPSGWHNPAILLSSRGGVLLCGEEDKTLRPCINDTGLNTITVKNRYFLPLISTAFDWP